MAPPWKSTTTSAEPRSSSSKSTSSSVPRSTSLQRVEEGQQTVALRDGGGGARAGGAALTLEDLVYTGGAEEDSMVLVVEEEEEEGEEWMVVEGGTPTRRRRERGSGSVPPSVENRQVDDEEEDNGESHPVRPKSRSFHHSGSSSPWRRTAMSSAAGATVNAPVEGLPFHPHLPSIPASTSTPNHQENLHLSIPNTLSYSLSSLSDPPPPPATPPRPEATTSVEPVDRTPPLLSPALSFLSAFSSPKSSIFLSSSSSSNSSSTKPVSPDDQGQPAGSTPNVVLGKLLGQGGSGIVREVVDAQTKERLNPPQAVKVVLTRSSSNSNTSSSSFKPTPQRIASEIALWSSLSRTPNLVPLLSHQSTPLASYLFMPFMPNGSLFDYVKRHREHDRGRIMSSSFRGVQLQSSRGGGGGAAAAALPEGEARRLFKGVVEGLRWLHGREGVVHGDLKAENVLIDGEGRCRIADFGLAVRYRPAASSSTVNSPVTLHGGASPLPLDSTPTSTTPTPQNQNPSPTKPKPTYPPNLSGGSSVHRAHTISSPHPRLASSPFPSSSSSHHQQRPPSPPTFPPGSLPYASPELLRPPSSSSGSGPSPAQDIWSLGVLLFFLLTSGTLPFQDAFEPRLQMKIVRGVWELPEGRVGKQAEEVLRGCLEVEVQGRWGVEEVAGSEWVEGWEEVRSRRSGSRSRSRQRVAGGVGGGGAAFELRGGGERSRSRGTTRRRDEKMPSTPNHSTSPPPPPPLNHPFGGGRRFTLAVDTLNPSSVEAITSPSTGTPSSSSGLPTPTSRSRSRGRSHQARTNTNGPSPSSETQHLNANVNSTCDASSSSSRSRSRGRRPGGGRSRSRKRGEGAGGEREGLVVEEMERVDEVEASLVGRGRR